MKHLQQFLARCFLFAWMAFLVAILPNAASGQTKNPKVGDKVQVKFLNKWYEAEVTEMVGTMMIRAKFDTPREQDKVWMFSLRNAVRPSPKSKTNSKSKKRQPVKTRTWTSAQGNFSVEAVFVDSDGTNVRLKKSDGQIIPVPLKSLSAKDNNYLKKLLAQEKIDNRNKVADQGEPTEESFESQVDRMKKRAEQLMNRGGTQPNSGGPAEMKTSDYRIAKAPTIDLKTDSPAKISSYKVAKPEYAGDSILVGDEKSPYKTLSLTFDPTHSKALIAYDTAFGSRNSNQPPVTVQIVDVVKGAVLGTAGLPLKNAAPCAISPDGKNLITQVVGIGRVPVRVDVWEMKDGQIEQKAGWNMPMPGFGVATWSHASFVNNEKVVTVSNDGKVIVWNIEDGQPVFQADLKWTMGNQSDFDIGSDGKTLIGFHRKSKFSTNVDVVAIDLEQGKVIGKFCDASRKKAVSVSNDQTRIAVLAANYLRIFDNNGEMVDEFTVNGGTTEICEWIDNQYLLLGTKAHCSIVDTKSRVKFWRYTAGFKIGRDPFNLDALGNHWQLEGYAGQKKYLRRYKVPHDIALAKIPDPKSVIGLGPGMSVAIRIVIPGTPAGNKQLVDKWTKRLNECGIKVDRNSNIEVVAKTAHGGTSTTTYESDDGEQQSATSSKTVLIVEIRKDGQPIWGTSKITGGAPGILLLREGETAQSKIDEYSDDGPGTSFYYDVLLPKHVIVNPHGNVFGYSNAKNGSFEDTETEKGENNALAPSRKRDDGKLKRGK